MTYSPQQQLLTKVKKVDLQLYNFLVTVDNFLVSLNGSNTSSSSSDVSVLDQLITGTTTISFSPVVKGQLLIVVIQQDGVGHTVTFDNTFVNAPSVSTTPGAFTTVIFIGRANNQWLNLVIIPPVTSINSFTGAVTVNSTTAQLVVTNASNDVALSLNGQTGNVTLAKLTVGGTEGGIGFTNGIITAFLAPT